MHTVHATLAIALAVAMTASIAHAEPIQPEVTWVALDASGRPMQGLYDVDVTLTGADNVLYSEHFDDVAVNNGVYTVQLGTQSSLDKDATGTLTVVVGHVRQEPVTNFIAADPTEMLGKNTGLQVGGLIGAPGNTPTEGLGTRGTGLGGNGPPQRSGYGTTSGAFDPLNARLVPVWPITVDGPLDPFLVDEVIKRHMAQLRYCFQREAVAQPDLAGTAVFTFTVALDGTVTNAATSSDSTVNNTAATECAKGRFERMRFPDPRGGVAHVRVALDYVP